MTRCLGFCEFMGSDQACSFLLQLVLDDKLIYPVFRSLNISFFLCRDIIVKHVESFHLRLKSKFQGKEIMKQQNHLPPMYLSTLVFIQYIQTLFISHIKSTSDLVDLSKEWSIANDHLVEITHTPLVRSFMKKRSE